MTKIINAAGREIEFDAAFNLMDNEISSGFGHGAGLTEQEFFDLYCSKHKEVFEEEFEPNKKNPTW